MFADFVVIDIGANLAHDSFDHDRDAVLQRAWAAGLQAIVVTGSSPDSSHKALALAQQYSSPPISGEGAAVGSPKLFATAGLHPHHASEWTEDLRAGFHDLALQPQVVSLGECGLDYFRDLSPRADQKHAFIAQLELAVALKKPLFLHQRDAHADFLPILREFRPELGQVVVHCFTDTRAAMEDYLALDCHIGITGWICDERRGRELFETARHIPDARLLIESDAPYLLPRTAPRMEHRRNEPCFLSYVVQSLARSRGQSEEHIARITTANARQFFSL